MARDPGLNTRTSVAADDPVRVAIAERLDALSDPQVEDLLPGALGYWPRGAPWGTPRGEAPRTDTVIAGLTRVLLGAAAPVYRRAWQLTREAVAAGADETLEAWETDYGLPDACTTGDLSRAERLAALQAKVAAIATITPADFCRLALRYGFEIELEEPALFECGFSECGGEHTCGDPRQEIYWLVRVTDLAVFYFIAGQGETGHDPLFSLGETERLLCILKRVAPAWTIPVIVDPEE